MIRKYASLLVIGLLGAVGCNGGKDTPGGPGADTNQKAPMVGHKDGTFTLTASGFTMVQGEHKPLTIGIGRGNNFQEDVKVKFDDLPTGVTVDPATADIKHGEKDAHVSINADTTAAVGTFKIKLIGHPTKGSDTTHAIDITVKANPVVQAVVTRDVFIAEKTKQLQELDAKYEAVKVSATKAEGQAKTDLEKKAEDIKVKRDLAAKKLEELKTAPPDKWENFKESVGGAFDDFKKLFQ